jgi:hypothetical protein
VRLEGLGQLEKIDLIGSRTSDLPGTLANLGNLNFNNWPVDCQP